MRINDSGHLEIGGCDTVELARCFGTPLYVFDELEIRFGKPGLIVHDAAKGRKRRRKRRLHGITDLAVVTGMTEQRVKFTGERRFGGTWHCPGQQAGGGQGEKTVTEDSVIHG